jgi:hypothetical protein
VKPASSAVSNGLVAKPSGVTAAPWKITTRPSASVIQRPLWPSGSGGAAAAVPASASSVSNAAANTRAITAGFYGACGSGRGR